MFDCKRVHDYSSADVDFVVSPQCYSKYLCYLRRQHSPQDRQKPKLFGLAAQAKHSWPKLLDPVLQDLVSAAILLCWGCNMHRMRYQNIKDDTATPNAARYLTTLQCCYAAPKLLCSIPEVVRAGCHTSWERIRHPRVALLLKEASILSTRIFCHSHQTLPAGIAFIPLSRCKNGLYNVKQSRLPKSAVVTTARVSWH